jgi:hypothetical protein
MAPVHSALARSLLLGAAASVWVLASSSAGPAWVAGRAPAGMRPAQLHRGAVARPVFDLQVQGALWSLASFDPKADYNIGNGCDEECMMEVSYCLEVGCADERKSNKLIQRLLVEERSLAAKNCGDDGCDLEAMESIEALRAARENLERCLHVGEPTRGESNLSYLAASWPL